MENEFILALNSLIEMQEKNSKLERAAEERQRKKDAFSIGVLYVIVALAFIAAIVFTFSNR